MRFTFLTQYFPPEVGAPQVRLHAMARELQRRGHGVQVVTAMPNYPTGRLFPGYRGKLEMSEMIEGIPVTRTWVYPATGRRVLARLLNYLSFAFSSLVGLALVPRADVLFVESPPLFLGLSGWLMAMVRGQRLCLNVSDLWPDSVVAIGMMREGFLVRAARRLERWLYQRAWRVCGTTRGIADSIAEGKGVAREKVLFLPNGVDPGTFSPQPPDAMLKKELGLNGKRVFGFTGTHGFAQGLEVILQTAGELRGRSDISFLFVGDGPEKSRLQDLTRDRQLGNVIFMKPQPVSGMARVFSLMTASIVPLREASLFLGARPSKMFPALSCAVPVIYSGEGEAGDLIRSVQCGLVARPGDGSALAQAVVQLADDPGEAAAMGQRGRDFVEREYGWPRIVECWLKEIGCGDDG